MENIELFNEYALRILVSLHEKFPVPVVINAENYIDYGRPENINYPDEDEATPEEMAAWAEYQEKSEEFSRRQKVFSATVHFLHSERFIRYFHPNRYTPTGELAPDDILIDRATCVGSKQRLNFALTAHGLAQLNKNFKKGVLQEDTYIQKIKGVLSETGKGASNAVSSAAFSALLPTLFSS